MTNLVEIANTNSVAVNICDWVTQVHFFQAGLSDGIWLALPLAVTIAIYKAVRAPRFPND